MVKFANSQNKHWMQSCSTSHIIHLPGTLCITCQKYSLVFLSTSRFRICPILSSWWREYFYPVHQIKSPLHTHFIDIMILFLNPETILQKTQTVNTTFLQKVPHDLHEATLICIFLDLGHSLNSNQWLTEMPSLCGSLQVACTGSAES